jgi:hypothetical protein
MGDRDCFQGYFFFKLLRAEISENVDLFTRRRSLLLISLAPRRTRCVLRTVLYPLWSAHGPASVRLFLGVQNLFQRLDVLPEVNQVGMEHYNPPS